MKVLRRHIYLLFLTLLLLFASKTQSYAQWTEYEIKAGLVMNFMKFTSWNDESFDKKSNKIILTIYGSDPFGNVIDRIIRGRTINGRTIEVRRTSELRDLKGSHVVFISRSERNNVCKVINYVKSFRRSSVLTIADEIEDFCLKGGMIKINSDYLFKMNWNEMSAIGLNPDNRLVNLAEELVSTSEDRCQ